MAASFGSQSPAWHGSTGRQWRRAYHDIVRRAADRAPEPSQLCPVSARRCVRRQTFILRNSRGKGNSRSSAVACSSTASVRRFLLPRGLPAPGRRPPCPKPFGLRAIEQLISTSLIAYQEPFGAFGICRRPVTGAAGRALQLELRACFEPLPCRIVSESCRRERRNAA